MKAHQLADAIVTLVNGGDYSADFTAERPLTIDYSFEQLESLAVLVWPLNQSEILESRPDGYEQPATVMLLVAQQLPELTQANLDTVLDVAHEILERIKAEANLRLTLADGSTADFMGADWEPYYDPDAIRDWRTVVVSIELTYQSWT